MNYELRNVVAFAKSVAEDDLALYGALLNQLVEFYSCRNATFDEYQKWVVEKKKEKKLE